jgi:hypothetical protein
MLFYVLQKFTFKKVSYFSNISSCVAGVVPTSDVRTSFLILLMNGNYKVENTVASSAMAFVGMPCFMKTRLFQVITRDRLK